MIKSKTTNLGIMEAVKELKEISLTDRLRYEYELCLKAKRDREAEIDDAYEQGQEAERERNLNILISTLREYGHTEEQIVQSLMEKYGISREAAEGKLKQENQKGTTNMLNLSELEQLIAFAELGTLSKTAEELHISQPTITRTMKSIEAAFGVPLFIRGKNKIELSETGLQAVNCAQTLLTSALNAIQQVQAYHARLHTISVKSCAPAPLWSLLPLLSARFPEQTVSSKLAEQTAIVDEILSGAAEIGILSYPISVKELACIPIVRENLSVCISRSHALADRPHLTLADLNGYNCLLRSEIGFWSQLCYDKMPASKFLIQTDDFAFRELIQQSTLPCFTTNLASDMSDILADRIIIPITDAEANVVYHLICKKDKAPYIAVAKQNALRHQLRQKPDCGAHKSN